LPLTLKMHVSKFGQMILRKIILNCCHQMSDFKAKMRKIPVGELTALTQTPSWILGGLLLREGKGRGGKGGWLRLKPPQTQIPGYVTGG